MFTTASTAKLNDALMHFLTTATTADNMSAQTAHATDSQSTPRSMLIQAIASLLLRWQKIMMLMLVRTIAIELAERQA